MKGSQPSAGTEAHGRAARLAWSAAAACLAVIFWMGLGWDFVRSKDSYAGKKIDYYSSQVHGFLSGHLYMDKEANPGLASTDPVVRARAPFLLDASYYKGHYYLYFGVTPAALFLLPYAWLTGSDLHPRYVVFLCTAAGFLLSVGILRMAARDHFKSFNPWSCIAAVAILAFASATPFLLTWAKFYEVAIAAGFAFTMSGIFWTYRALSGRGRSALQLGLASASFGLAVGCRPDLVLNVPVVAAAAALVCLRERSKATRGRTGLLNGIAAGAPVAAAGVLLGIYNVERFGSPFEFGVTYSMNTFMLSGRHLFSAAYLWPNIHWYYLTLPALSPYFPFAFPEGAYFGPPHYPGGEAIHGQFFVFVLFGFVAVSALGARRRLRMGTLAVFLGLVAWMFLVVLVAIAAIGFRGDRYMVDFQAPLALGTVLLASSVDGVIGTGFAPRLWRATLCLLAALAAGFNVFAGLQEFNAFKELRTSTYRALESLGNYPAYSLERMGLFRSGPIELKVVFPAHLKTAAIEPLLVAGTPEFTDSLYVAENAAGDQIEFRGDHSGYGGPHSDTFGIEPGRTYTLMVDMGALYPPRGPPFTAGFAVSQGQHIKTRIRVVMDGAIVLDGRMNSFDAPPWSLQFGKNRVTMNPYMTEFSGRILSATRLPPTAVAESDNSSLWRLRCAFPRSQANMSFPLLSAGVEGSGTMIYLNALPEDHYQFGLDEWGYGGGQSPTFKSDQGSAHVVEFLFGPIATGSRWPKDWGAYPRQLDHLNHALVVWMDGRLAWKTELRRPVDPSFSMFEVGGNSQGFTTAQVEFPGPVRSEPYSPAEAQAFVARNLELRP